MLSILQDPQIMGKLVALADKVAEAISLVLLIVLAPYPVSLMRISSESQNVASSNSSQIMQLPFLPMQSIGPSYDVRNALPSLGVNSPSSMYDS